MNILRSTIAKGITLFTLLFIVSLNSHAQFPEAIIKATKSTNAIELSKYFNSKIELVLPEKSGVFSSAQAKLVLNDFFKKS